MKPETTSDNDCDGCDGVGSILIAGLPRWRHWLWPWISTTKPCNRCGGTGIEPRRPRVLLTSELRMMTDAEFAALPGIKL